MTAALIAIAFALRRRGRLVALVLAGLLRPEAWALASLGTFAEFGGSVRRRAVIASMSALAAPLLWLAFDAAATGDPLATTHRTEAFPGRGRSWADVLEALVDRISPLGFALGALGIAGFVLHARARGRAGALLPAATIVVWPVVLVVEANRGFPIAYRYLLPAIVAVALGVGFLVARLVPRVLPAWAATALAATGVVVLTLTTRFDAETSALRVHRILAAAPGVERTLDCGTVAVAGPDRPSRAYMGALSAATRRSLRSFALAPPAPARGGVLLLDGAELSPRGLARTTRSARTAGQVAGLPGVTSGRGARPPRRA